MSCNDIFEITMTGGKDNKITRWTHNSCSGSIATYDFFKEAVTFAKLINSGKDVSCEEFGGFFQEKVNSLKEDFGTDGVNEVNLYCTLDGDRHLFRSWRREGDTYDCHLDPFKTNILLDKEIKTLTQELEESRKDLMENIEKLITEFVDEETEALSAIRHKLDLIADLTDEKIGELEEKYKEEYKSKEEFKS
jgi:hypothetical protein